MSDYGDIGGEDWAYDRYLDSLEERNNKVLICGDKNFEDRNIIRIWLCQLQDWGYDTIINGGAKGADTIATEEAEQMGFNIITVRAEWRKYGRGAGPLQNREKLQFNPDLVIFFHNNILESKGTKNMVKQALEAGIEVINGIKNETSYYNINEQRENPSI